MSSLFYKRSSILVAIAITIITFTYIFLVLSGKASCFEVADGGVKSLGTSFGFSVETVRLFFSIRTPEMIQCYLDLILIWDNIFAVLYGLMYVCWLSFLWKSKASTFRWLNLLPFTQTILDWGENFLLLNVGNTFLENGRIAESTVQVASIFCMVKWIVSSIVFLLVIVGIVVSIQSYLKKRKA